VTEDYLHPDQQTALDMTEAEIENPLLTMTEAEVLAWIEANIPDVQKTQKAFAVIFDALKILWKARRDS